MTEGPTLKDFIEGWQLFRDPVLCGTLAGICLGLLGVYVVMRRMVFMAAVLSQAAGLGVTVAIWVGMLAGTHVDPLLGAITFSVLSTTLFSLRAEKIHLTREAVLGMAWVGAGALALIIGQEIAAEAHDIQAILFGSAVLVRPDDLALVGAATALGVGMHVWLGRGLVFAGFDPVVARVHGLPVQALDVVLWLVVALVVSVATRALGALPVLAFSVLPGTAALLIAADLRTVFPLAAVLGGSAGALGYLLAFFQSWPVGSSQALVASVCAVAAIPVRLLRSR